MDCYDIGIIGFGNMGRAIAERIKANLRKNKVLIYDKDTKKTESSAGGIIIADNIKDLLDNVATVILAVKPQDFDAVLNEIKAFVKDKIIISIAAGITTGYIEKVLGEVCVIRAMPNLPAKIGRGMIGLCSGRFDRQGFLAMAEDLFYMLGQVIIVEEEKMNAITAVSGSGPAYVCYFLEKEASDINHIPWPKKHSFLREFSKAAEGVGFDRKTAASLVKGTFSGTVRYLKKSKTSPAELKKQVTSKGGTTEAALEVLYNGGALAEAVKAAAVRAGELSKT